MIGRTESGGAFSRQRHDFYIEAAIRSYGFLSSEFLEILLDLLNALTPLSDLENKLIELFFILVLLVLELCYSLIGEKELFLHAHGFIQFIAILHHYNLKVRAERGVLIYN